MPSKERAQSMALSEWDRPKRQARDRVFELTPWPNAPKVEFNVRFSQVRRKK